MKRIILSIVGSLLIGLYGVEAQQPTDTTGTASKSEMKQQNRQRDQSRQERTRTSTDQAWQQRNDRSQNQDAYANEGMVIIDKNELPPSLKQKLQDEKYAGWENGTIYHNTNTGEYVIAPRAYRFDKEGNEIEMKGTDRPNGNIRGRSSRYTPSQSAVSAQDQTDPDNRTDQRSPTEQQPSDSDQADRTGAGTQTQPGRSGREQYSTEGMAEVQAEQMPASLRRTLRERQYEGWEEKGTLYQDPSMNEYVLVMDKVDKGSQPRVYRFDKNGQPKDEEGGAAQSKKDQ